MTAAEIRQLIKEFRFKETFNGLGWNSPKTAPFERTIAGSSYRFTPIAEQGGVQAFEVQATDGEKLPDTGKRKAIDSHISGESHRNLLIFVNPSRTQAYIQGVVYRDQKRLPRGIPFQLGRPIEPIIRLFQALDIPYELFDQQGHVAPTTAIDIAEKPFLADKVTKKFFKEFSDKRKEFVRFLTWIEDESKREWYCSVLLNRLMFIYFVAERGFLPGGKHYLSNMLRANAERNGPDTFYTDFLLPLSFFGLGKPKGERGRFESEFEGVLYLNGGLFATHTVERELGITAEKVHEGTLPPEAKIKDSEFKKWLDYFNAWRWTLDEERYENDISPHVLGYIFEKYVNQKQMGAYYTKEDITGYICRNTIIPRLFDMLAEESDRTGDPRYRQAVEPLPIGPHPNLLNKGLGVSQGEGIDRYVYTAVKQTDALPTETAYEQAQREKRYEGILQDFDDGKIAQINDFITYNLDIERFAQDFVATIQDPQVLWAFWDRCLTKITVLDPTCGSGAFLFAALRILFPLYATALKRMEELLKARGDSDVPTVTLGGRFNMPEVETQPEIPLPTEESDTSDKSYSHFAETLKEVTKDHPHADYFIKKKIIVQNLYGVDIMEEAVEICKLRLFLELMRTVEKEDSKPNFGVEPLPDIDFNILSGNTLVGFTTLESVDQHFSNSLGLRFAEQVILERLIPKLVSFAGESLLGVTDSRLKHEITEEKQAASAGLTREQMQLRRLRDVGTFKTTHQPFHWLVEYPHVIVHASGFDAIVGNPPFVEYPKVKSSYSVVGYRTFDTGNLYCFTMERCSSLLREGARLGLITPIASASVSETRSLRTHLLDEYRQIWASHFAIRPAKLFEGVEQRLTIWLCCGQGPHRSVSSTKYHQWYVEERPTLLQRIQYTEVTEHTSDRAIPKIGTATERSILAGLRRMSGDVASLLTESSPYRLCFHRTPGYWIRATDFLPFFESPTSDRSIHHIRELSFRDQEKLEFVGALLGSSLYFWWFFAIGNCRNLTLDDVRDFRVGCPDEQSQLRISRLFRRLMDDYRKHSVIKHRGETRFQEFDWAASKKLVDEIDTVFAGHFGLDDDELAFLKNYDIKIRIGNAELDPQLPEEDV